MRSCSIVALHGFLGNPNDWEKILPYPHIAFDLLQFPILPFWEWGEAFNSHFSALKRPKILIGYSMGGRLAMHALINNPLMWDAAIIISAHTGIADKKKRKKRVEKDLEWSKRVLNDDWNQLIIDWNQQPIFQKKPSPFQRNEMDFDRNKVSKSLQTWSLGKQDDLKKSIESLTTKILWVVGSEDQKYVKLAQSLKLFHPESSNWVAPHACHRVPWEEPTTWLDKIDYYFEKLFD